MYVSYNTLMIIGYDASRAFTDSKKGVENVSFNILTQLAKIDHQNTYLVFTRGQISKTFPGNFHIKNINLKYLWTQIGLAAQTFIERMDVLFVPAHILPLWCKPFLKTVVMIYDFGSEYLPQAHSFKQRFYLHLMEKIKLQKATKIITTSNSTKSDLVSLMKVSPDKVKVVHLGVDREIFKPGDDALVNSLRPYYLFVGTIQPRKNLERVIIAFSRQPSAFRLLIAGSKGWLAEGIYRLPARLGVEDRVKFLGYVPEKDLPALYSQATALVFPALFEGFGLPILEAQACGCPVITSNLSSMPEVAGKGAILVNPYDAEAIVSAMIRVKGKGERGKLIQKGFENVKRFSWKRCAKQILEILENV